MSSKSILIAPFILIVFYPEPGLSQQPLNQQEAVNRALESRASLKAEAEHIPIAEGLKKQAGLRPNPEFQFQNENLRPGQTYGRDVDTLAMINQPLDVLGKRRERIALATESVKKTQADYELARSRVAQHVKAAYWTARGAQAVRDLLQNTVSNFQKTIDYHAAQLSAGAIAEQDLLRVRLEGERLQIAAGLAGIDANRARIELLKEMGATDFGEVILTEPLELDPGVTPRGIDAALAQRVEIRVAQAGLAQAKANATFQDVSARPDINVTYGYKRTQLPDTGTGVNTAIVSLRVTLPTADKNQGNRMAAVAEVRRQRQLLVAAEAEVRAEYFEALQDYESRRAEFRNTLGPFRQHASNLSGIAAAAYAEGGTDLLRLLDAERSRLDAELAYVRGLVDYRQSIVRLEAAEGVN